MNSSLQTLRQRLAAAELTDVGEGFFELPFFALGSECELFFAAGNLKAAQEFAEAAFDWLAAFEARYSRFLPDSEVSRINNHAGIDWTETDAQTEILLDLCGHSHFVTQGAFDATSLPLSLLWDWKRQHECLPRQSEIDKAKELVGWSKVEREPGRVFLPEKGMLLDFGGVGKEFAADCMRQIATAHGIRDIMVDLGGDIAVQGQPPEGGGWYVGLEDPENQERSYCGIRLRERCSVATSGDYRRKFVFEGQTYGHILDCRTGWPVANGTRAATVIAPRCTEAGLLATAAIILGGTDAIQMLERTPGVQGCLWSNGKLHETRGFRRSVLPAGWDEDT